MAEPHSAEDSDSALAAAASRGCRDAFAELLDRHYNRLFAFAWRLTGSQHEAEDVTHDICVALPRKLASYDGRAAFSTWLYRVAVNATHDRRRRQSAHLRAASGWGEWEQQRLDEDRHGEGDQQTTDLHWLQQAMARLPDDLRETVALVLGEGLSQAQTAEVLEISPGTVSWRMSEVKRRLRELSQTEERS